MLSLPLRSLPVDCVLDTTCSPLEGFEKWKSWADEKVCCDYGLQLAVTSFDPKTKEELETLVKEKGAARVAASQTRLKIPACAHVALHGLHMTASYHAGGHSYVFLSRKTNSVVQNVSCRRYALGSKADTMAVDATSVQAMYEAPTPAN